MERGAYNGYNVVYVTPFTFQFNRFVIDFGLYGSTFSTKLTFNKRNRNIHVIEGDIVWRSERLCKF